MSTVVRVPDEMYATARHIAALKGEQPSDVIATAWSLYLEHHRDEIADEIEEAARRLRSGDMNASNSRPAGKARSGSRRARAAA